LAGAAVFGLAAVVTVAGLAAGFALAVVRLAGEVLGPGVARFAGGFGDGVLVVGSSSDGRSAIVGFLRFGRIS
jgi:hypothetical protein